MRILKHTAISCKQQTPSIAQSLIELACEAAARECASRVKKLNLRVGVMSGVVSRALRFSFAIASEDTACAGAELNIEQVPATTAG